MRADVVRDDASPSREDAHQARRCEGRGIAVLWRRACRVRMQLARRALHRAASTKLNLSGAWGRQAAAWRPESRQLSARQPKPMAEPRSGPTYRAASTSEPSRRSTAAVSTGGIKSETPPCLIAA